MDSNKGKYRHHGLPHWDLGEVAQTITYRLADSIPPKVYEQILTEMRREPENYQNIYKRTQIEECLHANRYGSCILQKPEVAKIVIDAWKFHDGTEYDLYDWVVMPNHVHLLIRPYNGILLGKIIGAWKGFTAKEISKKFGVASQVWMAGYWDRMIRDAKHFQMARDYILGNPEKAGLTQGFYRSSDY